MCKTCTAGCDIWPQPNGDDSCGLVSVVGAAPVCNCILIGHLIYGECTLEELRRLYEQASGRCHNKKYAKALSQSLNVKQQSWVSGELISKNEAALQILPLPPTAARDKLAEGFGLSRRTVTRYRTNQRTQSQGSAPSDETSIQQASSSAVEEQRETLEPQISNTPCSTAFQCMSRSSIAYASAPGDSNLFQQW